MPRPTVGRGSCLCVPVMASPSTLFREESTARALARLLAFRRFMTPSQNGTPRQAQSPRASRPPNARMGWQTSDNEAAREIAECGVRARDRPRPHCLRREVSPVDQQDLDQGSKLLCLRHTLRTRLPKGSVGDSIAPAASARGFYRRRVVEESTSRTANFAGGARRDSPYSSAASTIVYRIVEPRMAQPLKLVPDPYAVTLGRICLAQVIISLSALTSTAVLLAQVVTVMNGSD